MVKFLSQSQCTNEKEKHRQKGSVQYSDPWGRNAVLPFKRRELFVLPYDFMPCRAVFGAAEMHAIFCAFRFPKNR